MRLLALMASVLALSSCVMTKEMTSKLNTEYKDRNVDDFFLKFGLPSTRHQLNSGDIAYVWDSGVTVHQMPMMTTVTTNSYGSGSAVYGNGLANGSYTGTSNTTAMTSGGGAIKTRCRVQIVTKPEGAIKDMKIIENTIGNWLPSRCDEVLF